MNNADGAGGPGTGADPAHDAPDAIDSALGSAPEQEAAEAPPPSPEAASGSGAEVARGTVSAEEAAPARTATPRSSRNPLRRAFAILGRIPHPSLRSRRGLFVLFTLIAGSGAITAVVGVAALQWTETADFCGRCHTMGPELKANAMSPHSDEACAECHVEPGVAGWINANPVGERPGDSPASGPELRRVAGRGSGRDGPRS